MGLKENFYQAMSELMGDPLRPAPAMSGASFAAAPVQSAPVFQSRTDSAPIRAFSAERADFTSSSAPVQPGVFSTPEPESAPRRTVIAEGAVLQGSIRSGSGVELYGEVYGDIVSKESVLLSGQLQGNAAGRDITLTGGRIKGNMVATGRVRVDSTSVIVGNIQANSIHLNGRIKGDLEIKESAVLDAKAVVAGNVTAGRISIAEGAVLQGGIRTTFTDPEKLFAQAK